MKKNIGKKFHLMAMLASLLICWGGVTACSNGSDSDDDVTSVKLKGNFFESDDENAEWIYCTEDLKETTESGIWEGEITAVRGWDKFGLEINGTWYGAEEGLEGSITDAKLVKESDKNFWLATDKGGKSKVTVNLNKNTITVTDAKPTVDITPPTTDDDDDTTTPGKDDNETPADDEEEDKKGGNDSEKPEEFSFSYEASNILENTASITIKVTNVTGTASDWWFWAKTDDGDGDKIGWNETTSIYEVTITDANKIAYIKKNGLAITGAAGLKAEVNVTQSDTIDNDESGSGDEKSVNLVTDISLSDITTTLPGILVAQGSVFSDVDESKTITVTITCNEWNTINDDKESWFHCNFNGENTSNWDNLIKLDTWSGSKVSTTITGDNIKALKDGGLYIVGNNKDTTITVTYE